MRLLATGPHHSIFIHLLVYLWNDLGDPVFDGVGLVGSKIKADAFLLAMAACSICVFDYFPFLFFVSIGWYCGAGVSGLTASEALHY